MKHKVDESFYKKHCIDYLDTPEGKNAEAELAKILADEIDKEIINQLRKTYKHMTDDNYNRAMEIVETKVKE